MTGETNVKGEGPIEIRGEVLTLHFDFEALHSVFFLRHFQFDFADQTLFGENPGPLEARVLGRTLGLGQRDPVLGRGNTLGRSAGSEQSASGNQGLASGSQLFELMGGVDRSQGCDDLTLGNVIAGDEAGRQLDLQKILAIEDQEPFLE